MKESKYYSNLFREILTTEGIKLNEQQRLHNYALSNKIITETLFQSVNIYFREKNILIFYSFDKKTSQDLTTLIHFNFKKIKYSSTIKKDNFSSCSFIEFDQMECPNSFYNQYNKDKALVEVWYHTTKKKQNELNNEEQQFYDKNINRVFLAKSIYQTKKNQYISPEWFYHTLDTSLIMSTPAKLSGSISVRDDCSLLQNNQYVEYDPRCRDWYKNAINTEGQIFTKPYKFAFKQKVGMTLSMQIKEFGTQVYSIDFSLTNLGNHLFDKQDNFDELSNYEGYTVLFHQENSTIFHHKYWSESQNILYSWPDIEYNSTTVYDPSDKEFLIQQIKDAVEFSQTKNYSIMNFQNVDKFFLHFKKNGRKYVSVIYPIDITSNLKPYNRQLKKNQIVLYLGRVHFDISGLIQDVMLKGKDVFIILNFIETFLILVIVIISLLHYAAVFIRKLDFQLEILIQYLKQKDQNDQQGPRKSKLQRKQNILIQNTPIQNNKQYSSYNLFQKDIRNKNFTFESEDTKKQFQRNSVQTPIRGLKNNSTKNEINSKNNTGLSFFKQLFKCERKRSKKTSKTFDQISEADNQMIDLNLLEDQFFEMSVLIKTFQQLENVINLIRNGDKDIISTTAQKIIKASSAKQIFNQVRNNYGEGFCYFQLGQLYYQQRKYQQASDNFQSSIQSILIDMGVDNIHQFKDLLQNGYLITTKNQLEILQIRIFLYISSLKELQFCLKYQKYEDLINNDEFENQKNEIQKEEIDKQISQINLESDFDIKLQSINLIQKTILNTNNVLQMRSEKKLITDVDEQFETLANLNVEQECVISNKHKNKIINPKKQENEQLNLKYPIKHQDNIDCQSEKKKLNNMTILTNIKQNTIRIAKEYGNILRILNNHIKRNYFENQDNVLSQKGIERQKELFILCELSEICAIKGDKEESSYYLFQAEQILSKLNTFYYKDQIDFFQSRIDYIFGTICIQRQYYQLGCNCLTSSMEVALIQEPIITYRCLNQLDQVFDQFGIESNQIKKQMRRFQNLLIESDSNSIQTQYISQNDKIVIENQQKEDFSIDIILVIELLPFNFPLATQLQQNICKWIQKQFIQKGDKLFLAFYCQNKLLQTFEVNDFLNDKYFNFCLEQISIEQKQILSSIKEYYMNNLDLKNNDSIDKIITIQQYQDYEKGWSDILNKSFKQCISIQKSLDIQRQNTINKHSQFYQSQNIQFDKTQYQLNNELIKEPNNDKLFDKHTQNNLIINSKILKDKQNLSYQKQRNQYKIKQYIQNDDSIEQLNFNQQLINSQSQFSFDAKVSNKNFEFQGFNERKCIQILFSFQNNKQVLDSNFFKEFNCLRQNIFYKKIQTLILQIPFSELKDKDQIIPKSTFFHKDIQDKNTKIKLEKVFMPEQINNQQNGDYILDPIKESHLKEVSERNSMQSSSKQIDYFDIILTNYQKVNPPNNQVEEKELFQSQQQKYTHQENQQAHQTEKKSQNILKQLENNILNKNPQLNQTTKIYSNSLDLMKDSIEQNTKLKKQQSESKNKQDETNGFYHKEKQQLNQIVNQTNEDQQDQKQEIIFDKEDNQIINNKEEDDIQYNQEEEFDNYDEDNNLTINQEKKDNDQRNLEYLQIAEMTNMSIDSNDGLSSALKQQKQLFIDSRKDIDQEQISQIYPIFDIDNQNQQQKTNKQIKQIKFFTSQQQLKQFLLKLRQHYQNSYFQLIQKIFQ